MDTGNFSSICMQIFCDFSRRKIQNKGSRIFVSVDGRSEELRFVITPAEVDAIMGKIADMDAE